MEDRVKELNEQVEGLANYVINGYLVLVDTIKTLCIERDAIRWCLDETRNPYPVEKPETT